MIIVEKIFLKGTVNEMNAASPRGNLAFLFFSCKTKGWTPFLQSRPDSFSFKRIKWSKFEELRENLEGSLHPSFFSFFVKFFEPLAFPLSRILFVFQSHASEKSLSQRFSVFHFSYCVKGSQQQDPAIYMYARPNCSVHEMVWAGNRQVGFKESKSQVWGSVHSARSTQG